MSNHFKASLVILAAVAILFVKIHGCIDRRIPTDRPADLRPSDAEFIRIDPRKHTVTIETPTGKRVEYAGRDTTVRVEKNGTVKVERKLFGLEHAPFIGVGYGDGALRLNLGVSVAYAYKWDLNAQLAVRPDFGYRTLDPVVSGSYNFYSNTSLFVGTNPVGLMVGLPTEYHVGILVKF